MAASLKKSVFTALFVSGPLSLKCFRAGGYDNDYLMVKVL